MKKTLVLFFMVLGLSSVRLDFFWDIEQARQNEVVQSIPAHQSVINWTHGKIRSEVRIPIPRNASPNIGRAQAQIETRVRSELRDNLLRAMGHIRISEIFLLRDYYALQTQTRTDLLETIHNAFYYPLIRERGYIKGIAELSFFGQRGIAPLFFQDINRVSLTNFIQKQRDHPWYDGVIVDVFFYAQFLPSLHFRIYDEDNNLIYGPEIVAPDVLVRQGVCHYVASLHAAFQSDRIGSRIFYVVPIAVRGRNPTEVVISRADARKLLANARTHEALRAGRVIVVKPSR